MSDAEFTQVSSITNILQNNNWHCDLSDNKIAMDLELENVKKYLRHAAQVVDKFSHL